MTDDQRQRDILALAVYGLFLKDEGVRLEDFLTTDQVERLRAVVRALPDAGELRTAISIELAKQLIRESVGRLLSEVPLIDEETGD
jgi:hypothetical protein